MIVTLLACTAPGSITLTDTEVVKSEAAAEDICEATNGTDPSCPHSGNQDEAEQHSCTANAAWLIVAIDTNDAARNDEVDQMDITFSDGSLYTTHNAAVEVPVMDDIKFMTSVVSNETLASIGNVYVYDVDGLLSGELVPTLADPWVSWSCPSG